VRKGQCFTSGHGIAGTVAGVEEAINCVDELKRWYGGVFAGPTPASARYRYANAIATPSSAVHR